MNRPIEEYRARLFAALAGFDRNEVSQAVDYYIELIEDADDPAEQMTKLGTPEQLAERIIKENGWSRPQFAGSYGYTNNAAQPGAYDFKGTYNYEKRKNSEPGARVAGLILTSPLWLSVFIIIFSILIAIWSVFISFPAGAAAAVFETFRWIGKYAGYAIPVFFAGVALVGLTLLFFAPVRAASKGLFITAKKFCHFLFGIFNENSDSEFKIAKKYFSKTALIMGALLTIAGTGVSVPLFAKAANSPEKFSQALGLDSYEYNFNENTDSIKVNIQSGASLYIKPSDAGKGAYLKCENVKKEMVSVTDSSEIGFTYDYDKSIKSYTIFNIGNATNASTRFYLYLPENEYNSADIHLSLGDVKVENFTAKNIRIECNCGDTKLNNVKQTTAGGSFTVINDLGDIKLENCTLESESANITQHAGDVKLSAGAVNKLTAENDLGDIKLESVTSDTLDLTNHCGDVKLTETSASGSITCKLDLGSAKFDLKGSDYNVSANTDLGDVKVNGQKISEVQTNGKVPVTVTNNTGDIKINFI